MQKTLASIPWHWLPPLLTLTLVLTLHLDVPYHDQWDLLPLLQAYYEGTLHWQTLLQPHNGHILLLPKTVMLLLAVLTHWNTLAEVLFGFVCMLASWQWLQAMGGTLLGRPLAMAEKTVLSLLVFSLSQAQNWLWGWQLQIPLALLLLLCGFAALLHLRNNVAALLVAALCGAGATLSFAGSVPYWLAVLPLLWQRQRWLVVPWLLGSAGGLALYLQLLGILPRADESSTLLPAASELLRHARNTLALLGNLVARYHMAAAVAAGLTAITILGLTLTRLSANQRNLALASVLFAGGSALMVSLSRAGLGDEQMLASRYGTLTLPFWTTASMLWFHRIKHSRTPATIIAAVLLSLSLLANNLYSWQDFRQLHNRLQRGSVALAQIDTSQGQQQLAIINPRANREQALQEVRLLQHYRLSFYRDRNRAE